MATVTDGERKKEKDRIVMIFKILKAKETATVREGSPYPPKDLYKNILSDTLQTAPNCKQFKCQ